MITGSDVLYEKLQIVAYPVYNSEGFFTIWKDESKQEKIYTIKEIRDTELFEIYDGKDTLLADKMVPEKVMDFIEADMNVGSPLPGAVLISTSRAKIHKNAAGFVTKIESDESDDYAPEKVVRVDVPIELESDTERIIREAAEKHGVDNIDGFLKTLRKPRVVMTTVKKKRSIDIDDLDE